LTATLQDVVPDEGEDGEVCSKLGHHSRSSDGPPSYQGNHYSITGGLLLISTLTRVCTFRPFNGLFPSEKKSEIMQFFPQILAIRNNFGSPTQQFSHNFHESRGPRSPFPNQCK